MNEAQSIWAKHAPKIASAREKDNELVALAFLPIVIPLGRFELGPLTIERLLWLEQLKSPFISGGDIGKQDVLAFLWIFSPEFKVGAKHGRAFCRRHWFIFWRQYAAAIGEFIAAHVEMMGGMNGVKGGSKISNTSDWLPRMMDGFASQYHWAEREILQLPVVRALLYAGAMGSRLGGKETVHWSPNADRARHDYILEINELNKTSAAVGARN